MPVSNITNLFSSLFFTAKKEDENIFSLLSSIGTSYTTMVDMES